MTTSPLIPSSSPITPPVVSSSANASQTNAGNMALTPQDFIQMMVTQLQNQDPLQPTSNADLLAQMSQIGQLQSSTDLQTSLSGMVLQNQIASAGNLIGKSVAGVDSNQNPVTGVVQSVSVSSTAVTLNLNNNQSLPLGNVTTITGQPASSSLTAAPGSTITTGPTAGTTITSHT